MRVPSDTRFEMQGDFNGLNPAEFQSISQHSEPSGVQDCLGGNGSNAPSGSAGQNQVQPNGGPQGGISSAPVVPQLQQHMLQQGPHMSSGMTMQQWQTTQAIQALTEASVQQIMMEQPPHHSSGELVRPWLREGSSEAPPMEQPLQPPHVPAAHLQMEHPPVPPELLPFWRILAYAMYRRLSEQRGQIPLPPELHLPTPAAVIVSNLQPYASQQQVINVFSLFGRITHVQGPQVFILPAHDGCPRANLPGNPLMHPVAVQARVQYSSRDEAIMAYSTFSTPNPEHYMNPHVAAITHGFLFVTLEVGSAGNIAMLGQDPAQR